MKPQTHSENTEFSEKIAFLAPLIAIFMHVFCCGIPLTLAVLSSVFGISANLPVFEDSPHADTYIFIGSGLLLSLSFVIYKKDCSYSCECEMHRARHKYNRIILITASVLYLSSLFIHLGYFHGE